MSELDGKAGEEDHSKEEDKEEEGIYFLEREGTTLRKCDLITPQNLCFLASQRKILTESDISG